MEDTEEYIFEEQLSESGRIQKVRIPRPEHRLYNRFTPQGQVLGDVFLDGQLVEFGNILLVNDEMVFILYRNPDARRTFNVLNLETGSKGFIEVGNSAKRAHPKVTHTGVNTYVIAPRTGDWIVIDVKDECERVICWVNGEVKDKAILAEKIARHWDADYKALGMIPESQRMISEGAYHGEFDSDSDMWFLSRGREPILYCKTWRTGGKINHNAITEVVEALLFVESDPDKERKKALYELRYGGKRQGLYPRTVEPGRALNP